MSVIFSAILTNFTYAAQAATALTGLGYAAHKAASVTDRLSRESDFELSQDGETVRSSDSTYSFVGFSENGDFSTAIATPSSVKVGKKLGKIRYDSDSSVWQLDTDNGEYIMIRSKVDSSEVFKKVS